MQRGICIDSTKEFEYLFDLRSFRRIDIVKIQGQCKSIVAVKIVEYEFGAKRYVQSKNPYFVRPLNLIISCLKIEIKKK